MTTWTHERGHLVANDDAGGVLLRLQADASFSPLADLLNANQDLGRLLLAGYGEGEQKRGRSPWLRSSPARPSTQPAPV
jgi:hypothetical protein